MDELIQSARSLVGLAALVGVLVLSLLWWSMRRNRERLHRQLDGREWQLGLRALVQGDGRPQTDEPREASRSPPRETEPRTGRPSKELRR